MNNPSAQADAYPPVYPHDPVEQIAEDVFMVRGSIRMSALMRITRNMAIVRNEGQLSLINPIRLSPEGEVELQSLGEVKHIIRLGPMHGVDDPYYVDRFQARLWCQPGGTSYPEPAIDVELNTGCSLPFPDTELFCFEGTIQPESVLLLKRGTGLLLTCDAIQHYGDYRFNNLPARLIMPLIGFPRTTIIGPFWLKLMTPEGKSLQPEFERLLTLEFDALLSAHGSFLATGAKAAVQRAVEKTYGEGAGPFCLNGKSGTSKPRATRRPRD